MARSLAIHLLIAMSAIILDFGDRPPSLTPEQQALVDHSLERYEIQGLEIPTVSFVFHDSLSPCHGHKGIYRHTTRTLEMCSLDEATMLHELAHAWANAHLDAEKMEAFVQWRGLGSWNDHAHSWEQRGTEHVAETIAWALADNPHHVKWVEILPNGAQHVTHRILTLDLEVETLIENFTMLTGMDPIFRDADDWTVAEGTSTSVSPEVARARG